jgi:hypothetical protein
VHVVIRSVQAQPGTEVRLLGHEPGLPWRQQGADLRVELPSGLQLAPAYVLKLTPALS